QNLFRRIEAEDKRIQNRVLGALDLLLADRTLGEAGDLLIERLNRFNRGLALSAHHQPQHPGMIPARTHSTAYRVCESFRGSNVAKQARRRSSAKRLVKHRRRKI